MQLGLIARCDQSGLGIQSWEFARHLLPDRVLLIGMGNLARGRSHPDWYDGLDVMHAGVQVDNDAAAQFIDGLDVVFAMEGTYRDGFGDEVTAAGGRLIVQANPELYAPDVLGAHAVVFPTGWETDRYDSPTVLPVPVASDRLVYQERDEVEAFIHVVAPAMADRNGTDLVLKALSHVTQDCHVVFHVPEGVTSRLKILRTSHGQIGHVSYSCPRKPVEHYWDIYGGADALLIPRRYGGLSLPMQEAGALGLPIIALDVAPQAGRGGVLTVPASDPEPMDMKGGTFDVWSCDPIELAFTMDRLVKDKALARKLSRAARDTAALLHWDRLLPLYERTLATS